MHFTTNLRSLKLDMLLNNCPTETLPKCYFNLHEAVTLGIPSYNVVVGFLLEPTHLVNAFVMVVGMQKKINAHNSTSSPFKQFGSNFL